MIEIEQIQRMSHDQLRDIWQDSKAECFSREESLWEYWRRVGERILPFSQEEFLETLSLDNARVADVVGLLARKDLLDSESLQIAQKDLEKFHEPEWLSSQLAARAMLKRLKSGETPPLEVLCDALLAKGTSWAAFEAVPLLNEEGLSALLAASDDRRLFTRGQRHELRARARQYGVG